MKSYEIGTKFVRISCECCTNLIKFSHLVHPDRRELRKTLPKEPFRLVADRTQRRRLQDLQQVVSRELAAPYTVKYLHDTVNIVLTLETRVAWTMQPERSMQERLIMAVWRIQSLHLSRTEVRYLVGSMTYGVVWEQVYGMLRKLASPGSREFIAYTGDDTAIHGAASCLLDYIGHLYNRTSCSLGTDGCIGCELQWMVNRHMRLRMSIAR